MNQDHASDRADALSSTNAAETRVERQERVAIEQADDEQEAWELAEGQRYVDKWYDRMVRQFLASSLD